MMPGLSQAQGVVKSWFALAPPGGRGASTDFGSTVLLTGVLVVGFLVSMRLVAWTLVRLDLWQLLLELPGELHSAAPDRMVIPDRGVLPAAFGGTTTIALKVIRNHELNDCPCMTAWCHQGEGWCCCRLSM